MGTSMNIMFQASKMFKFYANFWGTVFSNNPKSLHWCRCSADAAALKPSLEIHDGFVFCPVLGFAKQTKTVTSYIHYFLGGWTSSYFLRYDIIYNYNLICRCFITRSFLGPWVFDTSPWQNSWGWGDATVHRGGTVGVLWSSRDERLWYHTKSSKQICR